jgi:membrane protease YdiL (CAAX protease family)
MSCLGGQIIRESNKIAKLVAAMEVLLLIFCFFLMAWVLPSRDNISPELRLYVSLAVLTALFSLTFVSHLNYQENLVSLGLSKQNFWQAVEVLALPVFLLALIIIIIGSNLGGIHLKSKMIWQFLGIPFWGLLQQYLIQSFVNRRLQIAVGKGWLSISLTALVFALVHLPNPTLTIATLVAGLVWAYSFQKAPNLYPIALSHGLLSTLFANFTPKWLLPNMVVGYNYLVKIGWVTTNY